MLACSPLSRGLLAGRFRGVGEVGEADLRKNPMYGFQGDNSTKVRALFFGEGQEQGSGRF
jgi:hypothetical protein